MTRTHVGAAKMAGGAPPPQYRSVRLCLKVDWNQDHLKSPGRTGTLCILFGPAATVTPSGNSVPSVDLAPWRFDVNLYSSKSATSAIKKDKGQEVIPRDERALLWYR